MDTNNAKKMDQTELNRQESKGEAAPVTKTTLNYNDAVIEKIAAHAVENIEGLLDMSGNFFTDLKEKVTDNASETKGVDVQIGTQQVAIDFNVIVEYGRNIPDICDRASKQVTEQIKAATGLDLVDFTMNVEDILTEKEYKDKAKSLKDMNDERNKEKEQKQRDLK